MNKSKDPLIQLTKYETYVHEPIIMKVVKCYTTYGIKVYVELDRSKKTATIVEFINGEWQPKEFQFANRELKYMDGWVAIFRSCEQAIVQAKKDLEHFQNDEDEKFLKTMIALNKIELQEVVHNESAE